jgi:mono/diheme cytochrome c family protein
MFDASRPALRTALSGLVLFGATALPAPAAAVDEFPEFTESYLDDPDNIEHGKELWAEQCRHCHGRSAYPGKAPKLVPRRYEPDFVYARIAYGFRKMPAWGEVYSQDEIMDLVAFVMSDRFSP